MVGSSSVGVIVPSVKSDPIMIAGGSDTPAPSTHHNQQSIELDKDFLCPICMQIIKDAFLTSCGHSYCYMCIITHLDNKSNCPSCAHYLTANHIHPNFILNKVCFRNLTILVICILSFVRFRNSVKAFRYISMLILFSVIDEIRLCIVFRHVLDVNFIWWCVFALMLNFQVGICLIMVESTSTPV